MSINMTPSELDPVFAADTPITPDPPVRSTPRAQPSAPSADEQHRSLMAELVAQGYPPAEAMALAAREMARAHHDSFRTPPAAPPQPPAPTPPDMVPLTAQELRDRDQNPYTEPGPNMPDGTRATRPTLLPNERAARVYNERVRVDDAQAEFNDLPPDAAYAPSPRDRAMMARGFYPVYNQDGGVSWSVGTGFSLQTPTPDGRRDIPGGLGRNGVRPDLQQNDPSKPGFVLQEVRGPLGTVNVYRQNDTARNQQSAYMEERQLARFADASGMSESALRDMTPAQRREAVRAAKRSDANDRMNAWNSQMMLAGRNPTKNAANAYNALNDPSTNNWQRAVMANALRPDMDNTTPLTVDAMGAQNAMRLLNGINLGAAGGFGANNPIVQEQADQMRRDKAVARADALIAKYPRGMDGMYDAADVTAVRDAVELQHPGMGDMATAHLRSRPPAAPPSSGPPVPPPAPGPMNGLPPIGR